MPNASVRASVRAAEKDSLRFAAIEKDVITALMSHQNGRWYIWNLLESAHVFASSFTGDPYTMAFAEGERNFGLRLLNDIMTHCPEQFIQMGREKNARDDLDRAKLDAEPDDDSVDDPGPARKPTGSDIYGTA